MEPHCGCWTLEVPNAIHFLEKREFLLAEAYSLEPELSRLHPDNHNIRPKIRQQLQVLRGLALLHFLGNGQYRLTYRPPLQVLRASNLFFNRGHVQRDTSLKQQLPQSRSPRANFYANFPVSRETRRTRCHHPPESRSTARLIPSRAISIPLTSRNLPPMWMKRCARSLTPPALWTRRKPPSSPLSPLPTNSTAAFANVENRKNSCANKPNAASPSSNALSNKPLNRATRCPHKETSSVLDPSYSRSSGG